MFAINHGQNVNKQRGALNMVSVTDMAIKCTQLH